MKHTPWVRKAEIKRKWNRRTGTRRSAYMRTEYAASRQVAKIISLLEKFAKDGAGRITAMFPWFPYVDAYAMCLHVKEMLEKKFSSDPLWQRFAVDSCKIVAPGECHTTIDEYCCHIRITWAAWIDTEF